MHFLALESEQPEELMGCDLDSSADAGKQDGVDGVYDGSSGSFGDWYGPTVSIGINDRFERIGPLEN